MSDDLDRAKEMWHVVRSLGEACVALRTARDMTIAATGSTMAAASLALLHEGTHALLLEAGGYLASLAKSDDAQTRVFVQLLLDRLNHEPRVTVPPDDPPEAA